MLEVTYWLCDIYGKKHSSDLIHEIAFRFLNLNPSAKVLSTGHMAVGKLPNS